MRILTFIAIIALLTGCRSQKSECLTHSAETDSVTLTNRQSLIATLDSAVRFSELSFDTLRIEIERPSSDGSLPTKFRLTAIKGQISDYHRTETRQSAATAVRDSLVYRTAASESTTKRTEMPNLSSRSKFAIPVLLLISIFVIVALLYKRLVK